MTQGFPLTVTRRGFPEERETLCLWGWEEEDQANIVWKNPSAGVFPPSPLDSRVAHRRFWFCMLMLFANTIPLQVNWRVLVLVKLWLVNPLVFYSGLFDGIARSYCVHCCMHRLCFTKLQWGRFPVRWLKIHSKLAFVRLELVFS